MRFHRQSKERSVALIMAVAIMAVLAVVGFGFASAMKLEYAATTAIKNLAQARMAAQGALQVFAVNLAQDASAEPSGTAGPVSDVPGDVPTTETTSKWGNQRVESGQSGVRGEASKMNLNAFGNISKWDGSDMLKDDDTLPGGDASEQLYHGANDRFSSFEISFEEFFYQQRNTLWSGVSDETARIRAANMARAICLYRYGDDGRPGKAGIDDDNDSVSLYEDGLDNDGDGMVDEAGEGTDEPDEFNPFDPDGDGDTLTTTGSKDDRRFDKIEEFKDAISQTYSVGGTSVPAAVAYIGSSPDQDDLDTEAQRIYDLVKDDLTVHSYSLDIRSVSIDDPGHDGYDNDGDGKIDQDDTTGQSTVTGIVAQLNSDTTIYDVDIDEAHITKAAQAAYIYLKLSHQVTYTKSDDTTVTQALVEGFSVQNAVDIVDYRDIDCVPTLISAGELGTHGPASDTYGFEGLHITEVGRHVCETSLSTEAGSNWSGNSITVTADMDEKEERTGTLHGAVSANDGAYLLKKVSITALPTGGSITVGTVTKTEVGEFFVGPLNVSGGTGTISVTASETEGTYTIAGSPVQVLSPYIEIMNMSKRERDMTQFSVKIGGGSKTAIASGTIPGHEKVVDGFDETDGHGPYYGYFLIVYDEAAFDNNFSGGAANGTWGDAGEDFPICAMPELFANGFDGTQNVELSLGSDIVAGGAVDRLTSGTGAAFSGGTGGDPVVLAMGRTSCGGNRNYDAFSIETVPTTDGTGAPSTSPGRWNHNNHYNDEDAYYDCYDRLWPKLASHFSTDAEGKVIDNIDVITIADRGYYRSPAEVTKLQVADRYSTTMSLCGLTTGDDSDPTWEGAQPDIQQLPGWVVAARAPARININTASDAVMAAAFCNCDELLDRLPPPEAPPGGGEAPEPPSSFAEYLTNGRPYCLWACAEQQDQEEIRRSISNCFFDLEAEKVGDDRLDDDGDNVVDDAGEKLEWAIRFSNIFTLRANCFTVGADGSVKTQGGNTLASYARPVICDRGHRLDSDGNPATEVVATRPGSN